MTILLSVEVEMMFRAMLFGVLSIPPSPVIIQSGTIRKIITKRVNKLFANLALAI